MANIFKTTLKKDVIADIANCGKREVRFPITKFWATRLTDEYNLDDRTFVFKTFDSLEFSSPSNKDNGGETHVFDFDKTFVDSDEFVVLFKEHDEADIENVVNETEQYVELEDTIEDTVTEEDTDVEVEFIPDFIEDDVDGSDEFVVETEQCEEQNETETLDLFSTNDIFDLVTQWFEEEKVLDNLYADETVFATNARQVIILPKGKVLGFKKTLPVNNDAEVRIEFDTNEKIYFDSDYILDFDIFEKEVLNVLNEIRNNNFVFVCKRYTGIFMDSNGIYFGIKYSTRKSIGFNRKYNVQ